MDLIGFFYGFGVFHGLILAGVLLFYSAGHRRTNVFMALLVVAIALRFLHFWLIRTELLLQHPSWGMLYTPLDLAWGPLLYLYALSISDKALSRLQALHFLPFALMFLAPLQYALSTPEEQVAFLQYFWSDRGDAAQRDAILTTIPALWRFWIENHVYGAMFTLQFGTYCLLVLRQIEQHNATLERHYSSTEEIDLRWLRTLTYLCVFFLLLFVVFNRGQLVLFGDFTHTALGPNTPFLLLVIVIYIIGIRALRQSPIDATPDEVRLESSSTLPGEPAETAPQPAQKPEKYARSGISVQEAQEYKIRLMETMQEEELYLDCDLTLGNLADAAGMTYHKASQVINEQMNQKFFSFVNTYRIQRAKEMLADPATANMPIVELALEVGFKSKSSFYDAFKKATNLTPTQYRNSL